MKKISSVILFTLSVLILTSCQRKREPEKIIGGLPTDVTVTIIPAEAIQQYILLNQNILGVIIPVINRLALYAQPTFPELTPGGSSQYSFTTKSDKTGTANVVIQFFNGSTVIDPLASQVSSNTVTTISIAVNSGVSAQFSYSENLTLTFEVGGNLNSNRILTGNASFSGSNQTLSFVLNSPGSYSTSDGLGGGSTTLSGTGFGQAVSGTLHYDLDHNTNGNLIWEGQEGQFHFDVHGQGLLVTNNKRYLIP